MTYFQKMKKLQWGEALIGILLALMPFVLSPVCTKLMPNGMPMPCHYSAWLVTVLGIVLTVLALLRPLIRRRALTLGTILIAIVALILILFVPTGTIPLKLPGLPQFGLCHHQGMPCLKSFYYIKWLAGLGLLSSFIDLALLFIAKPER